jgi:hypothetical protein
MRTSANAEPYPIECSECGAAPGVRCDGAHANHISRGIDLAVARSPYEPVFASSKPTGRGSRNG